MMRRLLDKARLSLLRALLPKDEKLKEELAKLWLPRSPHSIWLGWDDVDMGGKRIRRVGTPIEDEDVARKKDVEQAGMPVGEAGDMIYHDGEKWTALKAPAAEKWLKHPGDGAAPEWADIPAGIDVWGNPFMAIVPQSTDTWQTYTSGSGYLTSVYGTIELHTGGTADSIAILSRWGLGGYSGEPMPSSERGQTVVYVGRDSAQKICMALTCRAGYFPDDSFQDAFVGFGILNNELYAVHKVHTDTPQLPTTYLIETFTGAKLYYLEIRVTSEPRAIFYVNGELVYEATENVPYPPGGSERGLCFRIKNTVDADKFIRIYFLKQLKIY